MKRNILIGILVLEAVACVLLRIVQASFTGVFSAAAAFPFEQIGQGLRILSLSGKQGNAAAIAIYLAVSLMPAVTLLIMRKRHVQHAEDGLLALLSIVLFVVLYLMINPGCMGEQFAGAAGQSVGKAVLGGMVYSVLCSFFILRVLRLFSAASTSRLLRYLSVMLILLNVIFVYLAFGSCFGGLLNSISALQNGNSGNEHLLGMSYIFLVLQFLTDALPYILDVFVVFAAMGLLDEMQKDRYSAETVSAAAGLSRLCTLALTATALSNTGFNLLQLLFAKSLMVINGTVQIPVFSIAFVLAVLLLTRFAAENKRLKDDNDMFI